MAAPTLEPVTSAHSKDIWAYTTEHVTKSQPSMRVAERFPGLARGVELLPKWVRGLKSWMLVSGRIRPFIDL